jgi:hypothetical protein
MKAKILFITLFLLLQGQSLFSQYISIELSVTWETGADIFETDSIISIPMLNITYRNNCDTNYYFLKVSPRKNEESIVVCWGSMQWIEDDLFKRAKRHGNYANQNFNVTMGRDPFFDAAWMIFSDTTNYRTHWPIETINCTIESIYDYYYREYSYDTDHLWDYTPSDVTPNNILGLFNDQFVFLKPNETHIETYNLIGFKEVEGCFTFLIDKDTIENYVVDVMNRKTELPTVVGEYHRYSGAFNTNKVIVCFGDRE